MINFKLNGKPVKIEAEQDMPLLWALRDHLGLTGTKFGCGGGFCGACTVHLDGVAIRACQLPLAAIRGRSVTTIEGLGTPDKLHVVQAAWRDINVPQCGYCQPGQIMSAVALLSQNPDPSDGQIDAAMNGNLCRCGTYPRVRAAIKKAAASSN